MAPSVSYADSSLPEGAKSAEKRFIVHNRVSAGASPRHTNDVGATIKHIEASLKRKGIPKGKTYKKRECVFIGFPLGVVLL